MAKRKGVRIYRGTSGCVIASRIADADPTMKILVVEAGPPVRDDMAHIVPARYLSHLLPTSNTLKIHVGKKSEVLGRAPVVSHAQCLGGASSINFMMYTRASASDYDTWSRVYKNPGWASADLLPLLKKYETYQCQEGLETHGYNGPLNVSYGGIQTEIGMQFLEVASGLLKRPVVDDFNDLRQANAVSRYHADTRYRDGRSRRQDVPHNYLYDKDRTTGLDILTGFVVKRVLVECETQTPRIAKARRLVVLSAGTFGSPVILERSGIGGAERLEKLGVDMVADLPGVGENYQDHPVVFTQYFAGDEADTLDGLMQGKLDELHRWTEQWAKDGTGMLASNGIEAGSQLRLTPEELKTLGPEVQQRWAHDFADVSDKSIMCIACAAAFLGNPVGMSPRKYITIGYTVWYSRAVGYLHATSADDVNSPLDFDPQTISGPEDLALQRWAYKQSRDIGRRMPLYRGEHKGGHPAFAPDSPAVVQVEGQPIKLSDPVLQYSAADDMAIDAFHKEVVATMWHSLGTCAMKPREQGGVVDSALNVYGVKGLKVADMSIAPSNVGSNTYSSAVLIGEKAATIIASELEIKI
ncbi:hypothetical protein POSPLADRAFT_1045608 [Postia placenta MAD-698-R-SB12]|uniref:Glucose-methanol-choline oxidoreductase N-terminal domain-containing protein n=1 Tax=Postia placenta MAD-698-R-SB12 TaxID=670580 RepID=A0A1X6N3N4_9APHY|nr:hypothetical protein POSPLADRAFT_1045608 [Postia placenta MAD-698-R-SB12]OSX63205.1 hypothetical protein POSPLADRAFT_1045608 [Postia placenta MAD-698-R-SB12]